MKRIVSLCVSLFLLIATGSLVLARPGDQERIIPRFTSLELESVEARAEGREDTLFLFAASGDGSFGSSGTDARGFTFEDLDTGQKAYAGWTSVDRGAQPGEWWHLADTDINAGTATDISDALPFNYPDDPENDWAVWCGRLDVCGWANPIGYGNKWDQYLRIESEDFESQLLIEFAYTGYFEGAIWDYFQVFLEVTTDGSTELDEIYRNNTEAEGAFRELSLIVLASNYPDADSFGDVILRFNSDNAYSDEDGDFISDIGACWVDNLRLRNDGVYVFETDFEDGLLPPEVVPDTPPSAGDFAELYSNLFSEDQCVVNNTYAWAFYDWQGPTENPDYPIPVVVYGPPYMDNAIWSPLLEMAHPLGDANGTPVDLGPDTQVRFHFWAYEDLPVTAMIWYRWWVAAQTAEMGCMGAPKNDTVANIGDGKQWIAFGGTGGIDVTPYVLASAQGGTVTGIAMGLNPVDQCGIWCDEQNDGSGHTPAPYFDNARLMLVNASAISWNILFYHRLQDNFPEPATQRVRIDSAADIGDVDTGPVIIADSTVVELNMNLDGGVAEDFNQVAGEMRPAIYLWYRVIAGPHEDVVEQSQADPNDSDGIWSPWAGTEILHGETWGKMQADEVSPYQAYKYAFDFHDNYFQAGDVIQYFYRARSGNGTVETRPVWAMSDNPDLRGYYVVRCLPSPEATMLFCDDANSTYYWWQEAFIYNGYTMYDVYTVQAPSSEQSNGLAGRAEIGNLDSYEVIVWDSGNLSTGTVCTNANDKTEDDVLLSDFLVNSDHDSYLWILGDMIANDLTNSEDFVTQVMGAQLLSQGQFYDDWNDVVVPKIYGVHPALEYLGGDPWFWADGGCPTLENFSLVEPNDAVPLAVASHEWEYSTSSEVPGIFNSDPDGNGEPTSPGGYTNRVLYNPFSYAHVKDGGYGLPTDTDYARRYVGDVLNNLLNYQPDTMPNDSPETPYVTRLEGNYPNPFNPMTTIRFTLSSEEHVNLSVFDIAGRRVAELVDGPLAAGEHELRWFGENGEGRKLASGVYFYKLNAGEYHATQKMVIIK